MRTVHGWRVARVFTTLFLAAMVGAGSGHSQSTAASGKELAPRADDRGGVRVEVVPEAWKEGQPLVFQVYFNTHSVDLSFDPADVATLTDAAGSTYRASGWEGNPPGGHHRSGRLVFPPVPVADYLKLALEKIGGVDRMFEWKGGSP